MIKDAIALLISKKDLTRQQSYDAMKDIMTGQATPSQIAAFLVALINKGETTKEIAGLALAMRDSAQPLVVKAKNIVDSCGTGGDGQGGLNVSTAAAFVVAGAGFTVAKHGNRSISSRSGSADVLERLGVKVDTPAAVVEECINRVGIGFMYAPNFHPAMKYAMPTRRELGIRTVFNLLGPLTNPTRPAVQLIGVYHKELTPLVGKVLAEMGAKAGLVVHSNGWDEIMLDQPTQVTELMNGRVRTFSVSAKDFGLPKIPPKYVKGGEAGENAQVIQSILDGSDHKARHVVVANAAALIWVARRAFEKAKWTLKDATAVAEKSLTDGAALEKLKALAETSNAFN